MDVRVNRETVNDAAKLMMHLIFGRRLQKTPMEPNQTPKQPEIR
jgi:hypothetical protein